MIVQHFTDNDLYKFSVMYAILRTYPSAYVRYHFIDRGETSFPEGFGDRLQEYVNRMSEVRMTPEEKAFLISQCPYFDLAFLDFLMGYSYNPGEVKIEQDGDKLTVSVEGHWYRTVLWEVPLLSMISELYFQMQGVVPEDVKSRALEKAFGLRQLKAHYYDFGTRRRFSFAVHSEVISYLKLYSKQYFRGTSNVYIAMQHGVPPIATMPHEWFMFHGAIYGCRIANEKALEAWVAAYQGGLSIALTDTYSTDVFYNSYSLKHAKLFDGVRWDSGDPFLFTDKTVQFYQEHKIEPKHKIVVYSNMLNVDRVQEIKAYVDGRVRDVYAIGTYFSNDVGIEPLNIVFKLSAVKAHEKGKFYPAVKLSDSVEKQLGDPCEIELLKRSLGL